MAGESVEALFRSLSGLTADSNSSIVQLYALWAGYTVGEDDSLYRLVCKKLTADAKSSQIEESLEATLRKGGAVGESLEEMLLKTGLTGWS